MIQYMSCRKQYLKTDFFVTTQLPFNYAYILMHDFLNKVSLYYHAGMILMPPI